MKKNIFKAIICSLMALPVIQSCELDQFPSNALDENQSWASYTDATNQYKGLLAALRSDIGGYNAYISDAQSDLFNQRVTSSAVQKVQDWTFTGNQFDGDNVYAGNYSVIKQANFIIQNIGKFDNDTTLTESQKAHIANYKATAYFARAYAYSQLVLRYCKDYEPETASTTLGLPIVCRLSSTDRPVRSTLQATCDSIEAYMHISDSLFTIVENYNMVATSEDSVKTNIYRPNIDALTALRARFYLYEHKYDQAIAEAKKIVQKYGVKPGKEELFKLWITDNSSEIIYEPQQTDDEVVNSYTIYTGIAQLQSSYMFMLPDLLPTQGLIDLYNTDDLRLNHYFSHGSDGSGTFYVANGKGTDYTIEDAKYSVVIVGSQYALSGKVFAKYPGNPALRKQSAFYTGMYNMTKAFRGAEAYLIIAEASLRKANKDEATAREYLNLLREARYRTNSEKYKIADNVTGEDLMATMQEEWTREFVGEGFRLDCLKRWHQGFKRMKAQSFGGVNILINSTGYQDLEVSANDHHFVWPIPQNDIQTSNGTLKQNEGY